MTLSFFHCHSSLVSLFWYIAGDKWRPRRKLLTPAFHFKILDEFMASFNEKSMASVAKIEEILGTAGQLEAKKSTSFRL
jgi:hypothetical protein